jgi:hypothetical protein
MPIYCMVPVLKHNHQKGPENPPYLDFNPDQGEEIAPQHQAHNNSQRVLI